MGSPGVKARSRCFRQDFLRLTNLATVGVSLSGHVRYTSADFVPVQEPFMSSNAPQNAPNGPPIPPGKLKWVAVALLAVSAFMFISIILKTALKGP